MRWRNGRRSSNIEDRRGMRISRRATGGGLGVVILALVAMYFGVDPSVLLQGVSNSPGRIDSAPARPSPEQDQLADFVSVVLADTEDVWDSLFRDMGRRYQPPHLVLFSGAVESACGLAQAASGPFYCPGDDKVYIDLAFYQELKARFHAPGDFAQAYVIAHEIGHHVQNLLGISKQVRDLQARLGKRKANLLSVRVELQADCFAGVWANHAHKARQILEAGDIDEALNAASAIGDDRLQKQTRGYVSPDSFTHGSAEQRVRWFRRGIESGDLEQCDTFDTESL